MFTPQKKLAGWKQCIMPVTRTVLTPRIDEKSQTHRGVKIRGERCRSVVPPEHIALYGAAVCVGHIPHYLASLKSSVEHQRDLRARLDPGCAVE